MNLTCQHRPNTIPKPTLVKNRVVLHRLWAGQTEIPSLTRHLGLLIWQCRLAGLRGRTLSLNLVLGNVLNFYFFPSPIVIP
jgi:hypothetical protein